MIALPALAILLTQWFPIDGDILPVAVSNMPLNEVFLNNTVWDFSTITLKEAEAIDYNVIGLPQRIDFDGAPSVCIDYAADGTKLTERPASVKLKTAGATAIAPPVVVPEKQYFGAGYVNTGGITTLYTSYGYFTSDGAFHAYIHDSRGNVAAVVNASTGAVEQQNSYYPYGATTSQSTGADVNPLKFGGKELTTLFGRHEYDYSARMYAPLATRFSSPDRKAWDYPWLSPYCFCAADPINYIDPTGEDVIILLVGDNLAGHLALMVEADNGKWLYYSINGDKSGTSSSSCNSSSGGKNDIAIEFSGLEELLRFMTLDKESDEFRERVNVQYGYSEGYLISTTKEQDQKIRDFYSKDSNIGQYSLRFNNCAIKVQQALNEAGLEIPQYGSSTEIIPQYESSVTPIPQTVKYKGKDLYVLPRLAYKALKSNPGVEKNLNKN